MSSGNRKTTTSWRWVWVLAPIIIAGVVAGVGVGYLSYLGLRPAQLMGVLSPPFRGMKQVNVLILGVDSTSDPRRSDTIMVARLDLSQRRVGIISIPRDFRAAIPGHDEQKINAAYSLGGVALTQRTVEGLLGIGCDYYVTINSPGLARLVDALGGVEVNVDKRMYYRDRSQGLVINLQPGLQRLNGEQAVGYVRYRHDRLGDLTRIGRQQAFLRAVLREAMQPRNLARLPRLLKLFSETVETDLDIGDLRAAADLVKGMDPDRVKAATLPGVPTEIHGVSYLEPDSSQVTHLVNEVLFNVPPRVAIVNATAIPGVEQQLVRRLSGAGYEVAEVRFATHTSQSTEVVDRSQHAEDAAQIQRWLNCGSVVHSNGEEVPGADITVLLGTDYLGTGGN
jgi:LCP family protein required for cell wall assembly